MKIFLSFHWLILHHVTKHIMHISPISEEREKVPMQNGYNPRFEGYGRYFTDIAHAYFEYVLVFIDSDQNFGYKLYQSENFGFELVSDGYLEMLLDNADDPNTNKLIKCVVTQF